MNLSPVVCFKLVIPERPIVLLPAQLCDFFHLPRSQLELRDFVQVALHAQFVRTCRDSHQALIDAPPQPNLTFRYGILISQLLPYSVNRSALRPNNWRQWAVARYGNFVLAVEVEKVSVLQIGVELDLVNGRLDLRGIEDCFEVRLEEVGDANGFRLA